MSKNIRICFISHSSNMGGAERSLLETIELLESEKVKCFVILPRCGPLYQELKAIDIPTEVIPYKWWTFKRIYSLKSIARLFLGSVINLIAIYRVMRKIKGWDCNVVYTNTITVYVGAVAAKILKLPHIWHIREFGAEDHGFRFFFGEKATYRIIDLLSNNIIANSFSVSDKCKKHIHSSKIIVAYNPAILKQNAHSEKIKIFTEYNNCFKCMIAGTLSEGKRQEEAIRGINEVIREGYNVKLYIIGKGAKKTENKLKKLVVNLGIEKNVIFTGYLENAAALMRYIDAVLVCSRNEAYGRVTIEAMRNGKPVVGAKSGGTRELVENAKNGLLYIPGDYIDLAKKVKFLVTHREIAKDMGLKGGKWVQKNITAQIYRDQILELLHDTVNTP